MRDYRKEHQNRMKSRKRLVVELEKEKAQKLEAVLKDHEMTFSYWINKEINNFISEGKKNEY
jgi:hypothetical protein